MAVEISFNFLLQLENLLRRISMLIPESADTGELCIAVCGMFFAACETIL